MKYTKISAYFLFGALGLFLVQACTDLEPEEKDSIVLVSDDGGFTPGDASALLASAYTDLGAFTDQRKAESKAHAEAINRYGARAAEVTTTWTTRRASTVDTAILDKVTQRR